MSKVVKRIIIAVVLLVALAIIGVVAFVLGTCAVMDHRNKYYYKYANPAGEIEKKYTAMGDSEVSYAEYSSGKYKKYEIWYPSDLPTSAEKYPLVIMANGTGITASQYKEVFKRLASWGYVVAGNEDENSRSGGFELGYSRLFA